MEERTPNEKNENDDVEENATSMKKESELTESIRFGQSLECNNSYDFDTEINKLKGMIPETTDLFEQICQQMTIIGTKRAEYEQTILKPVVTLLKELIENARPPFIYLLGRSRNGKSSLINALTNSHDAKVDPVVPTTMQTVEYNTQFSGQSACWKIVDSSGFFSTSSPSGTDMPTSCEQIQKDLSIHKPDIILYVVCSIEVGNLLNDLQFLKSVFESMDSLPPVVVVLTKADILGDPRVWPPEKYDCKQKELEQLLNYMTNTVLGAQSCESLDDDAVFYGCEVRGCEPFFYVIPTAILEKIEDMPEIRWNIDRLKLVISSKLPCQAWMHFYKGYQQNQHLKLLSSQIIRKLAGMSLECSSISFPGQCTRLFLLQMLMIGLIAKLSGNDISISNVYKFLAVCDALKGLPSGLAAACWALLQARAGPIAMVLGAGASVGRNVVGVTNASVTYCLGKAAELYYFYNVVKKPESFITKCKFLNY